VTDRKDVSALHTTTLDFDGIEDASRLIQGSAITAVQLRSGVLRGRIHYASTEDFAFSAGRFWADIRSKGALHPSQVTLGVQFDPLTQITQWGRAALPGDIFVIPPGSEQEGRTVGRTSYATISMDLDILRRHASMDGLLDGRGLWEQRAQFRSPPAVRAAIGRSMTVFARTLATRSGPVAGRDLDAFRHDLIETYLSGIIHDGRLADRPPERLSDRLVREIEAWITEQPAGDVHVADICVTFGVSRRTLQRAFQEALGVGPAHYLILRRLSAARSRLAVSDPRTERVTNVALEHGFWELGRFAVQYRSMFGEKPSETLRRTPDRVWR